MQGSAAVHIIRERFTSHGGAVVLRCTCGTSMTGRDTDAADRLYSRHILAEIRANRAEDKGASA